MTLFERVLPRHLQIIYLLNRRSPRSRRSGKSPTMPSVLAAISLIDERDGRHVRMGHLAFLGCSRINGVSAMHTELMRKTVFRDLNGFIPTASST